MYPSVAIDEVAEVVTEILNNVIDNLQKRTKLTLTDIQTYQIMFKYFVFDNHVRILENQLRLV